MQVSVEAIGELERRLTIQIPSANIDQEVDNRLRSMVKTARVDGFRPGKVPLKVLQQKYEGRIREEVLNAVIQSSYKDALTQQNLRPAGDPKIEPQQLLPGQDFKYTALIEVYPELAMPSTDGIVVHKPVAEIIDADVDGMLNVLRRQRLTWQDVSRPAGQGDRVILDYSATMGDATQPFIEEKQTAVIIGSQGIMEGFEERLVGMGAGDNAAIDLTYPGDHPNPQLAGQPVRFQVHVESVAEAILPALDEKFASEFGVTEGGIDGLRKEVAANMNREMTLVIKTRVKDQVLDGLLAANPIKIPSALVEEEIDRLVSSAQREGQGKGLPRELYRDQAMRRVSLGLLIAEVVKHNRIAIDPARVRSTVETIASSYEEPEQVVKWYYGNRELLSGIEALVLEDQVVDLLLGRATVDEVPTTFQALMNPAQ